MTMAKEGIMTLNYVFDGTIADSFQVIIATPK